MVNKKYKVEFKIDFRRNPHRGLYIAFEGIDGAGKTVQVERLLSTLHKQGMNAETVSEPRRTGPIGRLINEFLQQRVKIPTLSLQYLFSADRIAHQQEAILPSLKQGTNIISHRCFWSAVPYGILDRMGSGAYDSKSGEVLMVAQSILSMYHQVVAPDLTFYLDVSEKVSLDRLNHAGITAEYYETREKLKNVRQGYEWMLKKFPSEFVRINGDRDPDEVEKDILQEIKKFKKRRKI